MARQLLDENWRREIDEEIQIQRAMYSAHCADDLVLPA